MTSPEATDRATLGRIREIARDLPWTRQARIPIAQITDLASLERWFETYRASAAEGFNTLTEEALAGRQARVVLRDLDRALGSVRNFITEENRR